MSLMINGLLKRVERLENNQEKPHTATLVYQDGSTKNIRYDFEKIFNLVAEGTEKTGIVDVIENNEDVEPDGFWKALKGEGDTFLCVFDDTEDDSDTLPYEA